MDYKKKYEQALENIKKIKAANKDNKELVDFIEYQYPEFKENEDKRIRKWLIGVIKSNEYGNISNVGEMPCPKPNVIAWLEKQGEQEPTDKVKSKFKVGDWITDGLYNVFQIIRIEEEWYIADDGDRVCLNVVDRYYHLWTIQDAKNGDILQANKCTLIFDSLTKDIDGNTVISSWYYCDTKTFYGMGTCKPDLWTIEGVVPATKEECDLLFSKMKEAGYEWNAEKKELKKIEQKFTWNEDDEKRSKSTIEHLENSISDTPSSLRPYIRKDINWLKSLKQRMKGE